MIEIDNFLNENDIKILIDYYDNTFKRRLSRYSFWDERVLQCHSITKPKVRKLIASIQYKVIVKCCKFFDEECVYPDHTDIVTWKSGMELKPHVDNMHIYNPDLKHNTPHRDYSSIIYLNDNYEGGNTIFPNQNYKTTPKAGKLIVFPSGSSHPHGVTEVTSGVRYTLAMWFTKDLNHISFTDHIDKSSLFIIESLKDLYLLNERLLTKLSKTFILKKKN
tara:strand:+ start:138 stop:797 length:660 start_codon:yes stop_codon:yes gene_type:complete